VVADNETQRGAEVDGEALAALIDEARQTVDLEALGFDEGALDALLASIGPEGEVVDPADLWKGMPEFEMEDKQGIRIVVHFETEEYRQKFFEKLGIEYNNARAIWYPERPEELTDQLGNGMEYITDES